MTPAAPFTLADPSAVASPALLVSPAQIRLNLAATVALAGGVGRLRPHVKTHKMPDVVRLLVAAGVSKHKAATIAEAEILAANGAADVLVAYPLVGPNPRRLAALAETFPAVAFAALVDSSETLAQLASAAESRGVTLGVWLDLDVGMGRTGAGAETLFAARSSTVVPPAPDAARRSRLRRPQPGAARGRARGGRLRHARRCWRTAVPARSPWLRRTRRHRRRHPEFPLLRPASGRVRLGVQPRHVRAARPRLRAALPRLRRPRPRRTAAHARGQPAVGEPRHARPRPQGRRRRRAARGALPVCTARPSTGR